MSWAGRKSLKVFFRSLFRKEQAPSADISSRKVVPLLTAEYKELEDKLELWVKGKGYRLPDRSLKESARRIGADSVSLCRYFAAQGVDFRSWRTGLRMQDAMQQMKEEPQIPISTIARRVGISDRSNFSRQFKSLTGLSPEDWRKNQK